MQFSSHSSSSIARPARQRAFAQGWRGILAALVLVALLLLLGGCMVQSKVQGRYVEDQGECRDSAEGNISGYERPGMNTKDRNAQLVTLFANCMGKRGWQVARPKRTTTTGPHGPLDPYSTASKTTTTTTQAGPAQQQPMTQQQYQQEQQKLIQQQQQLAQQQQELQRKQQQVNQNSQQAVDLANQQQELQRQQQELLRQQVQMQQRMQQQQRALEAVQSRTPVQTTTTPLSPSGGMPPLAQPSGGASYYQPGRSYTSPTPQPYGSGAGRNF